MIKALKYYLIFSFFYLLLIVFDYEDIAWYFKPLLLPFLIFVVLKFDSFKTKKWLVFALISSWIGDIILLFSDKGDLYFILGLISFLVAHLFFIILFAKQKTEKSIGQRNLWIGITAVLLYLGSMLSLLFPKLGNLKLPVTIYALTISIMLVMTIRGYFSWKEPMNSLIVIGAVFFITSDSLLAIDKFYNSFLSSHFLIMFTYIIAQFCITKGILELNQKK